MSVSGWTLWVTVVPTAFNQTKPNQDATWRHAAVPRGSLQRFHVAPFGLESPIRKTLGKFFCFAESGLLRLDPVVGIILTTRKYVNNLGVLTKKIFPKVKTLTEQGEGVV